MRTIIPALLALALGTAFHAPADAQERNIAVTQRTGPETRRLALVIGNSRYRVGPLRNPVNDARAIASQLRSVGFEVLHVEDGDLREMETAVREFGSSLKRGGTGLFYYAGHGLQVAGENYLIPVDAAIEKEEDVRYEAMPVGRVLGEMDAAENGLNMVILDACRNNPFARSWRSADQGLAQVSAPTGTFIAYATAPGSVASDGDGENGLYTEQLLRFIRVPGLPVEEVFKQVRIAVMRRTNGRQVPWESSSLVGNFAFAGDAGVDAVEQPGTDEEITIPPTTFGENPVEDLPPPPESQEMLDAKPDVWAVVIGVNDYQDSAIPDLRYARRDAEAFRDYLVNDFAVPRGNVITLLDEEVTARSMLAVLGEELARRADPQDMVIVYYAGHGAPEAVGDSGDGDGAEKYLIPWDANPRSLFSTGFSMDNISRIFGRIRAQTILFVSDVSFSGRAGDGRTFSSGFSGTVSGGYMARLGGTGRIILTASMPNQLSYERDDFGHGVFTYHLLDGLRGAADRDGDGVVTADEAFQYVQDRVPESTNNRQTPMWSGNQGGRIPLGYPGRQN